MNTRPRPLSSFALLGTVGLFALTACGTGGAPVGAPTTSQTAETSRSPEATPAAPATSSATPSTPTASTPPSTSSASIAIPSLNPAAAVVKAGTTNTVKSSASEVNLTCQDGKVVIETIGASVNVSGRCEAIEITGNANSVRASDIGSVLIDGIGNDLSGGQIDSAIITSTAEPQAGANTLKAFGLGTVSITGIGNTVASANIATVKISGGANTVTYQGTAPDSDVDGEGNSVVPE